MCGSTSGIDDLLRCSWCSFPSAQLIFQVNIHSTKVPVGPRCLSSISQQLDGGVGGFIFSLRYGRGDSNN